MKDSTTAAAKQSFALLCMLLVALGAGRVATAAEEFEPAAYFVKKVKFRQSSQPGKDTLLIPASAKSNFVRVTPQQLAGLAGGDVLVKVGDYCRSFGPIVNASGSGRKRFTARQTTPGGEILSAAFKEGRVPLQLGATLGITSTSHSFPSGSFPRAPRPGDPSSLPVTLVVGGVGGTFDTVTGARLPFADPSLQTASEGLPDHTGLEQADVWEFEGTAGQILSFRVDTVGPGATAGIDPVAELIAPDGVTILAKADDEAACTVPTACGFQCPSLSNLQLPTTGTYRIVVHDFGALADGCDQGGNYSLAITQPACAEAHLAIDTDPIVATCGNDVVEPGEDCEDASACASDEYCDASCQCAPLCGNGVLDPGELCEEDGQCAGGESCISCSCRIPVLGDRTMTLDGSCSFLDTSLSPIHPPGRASGSLVLRAGSLDPNGIAAVAMNDVFVPIPIALINSTTCVKLTSCTGQLLCNGGANVDVTTTLDSLASGLSCVPNNLACSNACEGFVNPHSGNSVVFANDPGGPASPPGSMLLNCTIAVAIVSGTSADCSAQTYPAGNPVTLTTGSSEATVLNFCAGSGAPSTQATTFAGAGQAFDCSSWASTNGPGRIVLAVPAEEPNSIITGDGANLFSFCDAP